MSNATDQTTTDDDGVNLHECADAASMLVAAAKAFTPTTYHTLTALAIAICAVMKECKREHATNESMSGNMGKMMNRIMDDMDGGHKRMEEAAAAGDPVALDLLAQEQKARAAIRDSQSERSAAVDAGHGMTALNEAMSDPARRVYVCLPGDPSVKH